MASEVGVYDVDPKDVLLKVGKTVQFTNFESIETFIDKELSSYIQKYKESTRQKVMDMKNGNHKYIKIILAHKILS